MRPEQFIADFNQIDPTYRIDKQIAAGGQAVLYRDITAKRPIHRLHLRSLTRRPGAKNQKLPSYALISRYKHKI